MVGFANLPEDEEIAAFVVPSGNLAEASLVAHCRARLSSDKRPRKFAFVTELPRNASTNPSTSKPGGKETVIRIVALHKSGAFCGAGVSIFYES